MLLPNTNKSENPAASQVPRPRRTATKVSICSSRRFPPDSGAQVIAHVMAKQDFLSRNFYKYRQLLLRVRGRLETEKQWLHMGGKFYQSENDLIDVMCKNFGTESVIAMGNKIPALFHCHNHKFWWKLKPWHIFVSSGEQ